MHKLEEYLLRARISPKFEFLYKDNTYNKSEIARKADIEPNEVRRTQTGLGATSRIKRTEKALDTPLPKDYINQINASCEDLGDALSKIQNKSLAKNSKR